MQTFQKVIVNQQGWSETEVATGPSSSEASSSIMDWLNDIHLEQYTDNFKQSGYCTVKDCGHLNNEILLKIGVTPTGHRKRILKHLRRLLSEAVESKVSRCSPKLLSRGTKLERSPPKDEVDNNVSKLRTIFTEDDLNLNPIHPVSIRCINSKNKTLTCQLQQVETQEKCLVSRNHKMFGSETDSACSNPCEPQDDVASRPPLPPRVRQGTPPHKFTGDTMSLPSDYVDSLHFPFTSEQSTSAETKCAPTSPPDSPLFEFQGEMILNDFYDGMLGTSEQVTSCPMTPLDLRHKPVPQLPSLCKAQGVVLDATDNRYSTFHNKNQMLLFLKVTVRKDSMVATGII